MTRGEFAAHKRLRRLLLCGSVIAGTLQGQENLDIRFDPRETGELTWMDAAVMLLGCCVLYALWTAFAWLLQKHRLSIPWKALRLYVPSFTLTSAWIIFWVAGSTRISFGGIEEILLGIFALVNLPGVVVGGVMVAVIDSAQPWMKYVLGSAGWWVGWYGAVRFAEWKAWANVPVVLKVE